MWKVLGAFLLALQANACAAENLTLVQVSGRVCGFDGTPLHNVAVEVVPAEGPRTARFRQTTHTGVDGKYSIGVGNQGLYVVGVNMDGLITGTEPFPTTYYPGVLERNRAAVLEIASEGDFENIDIRIPLQLPVVRIEGHLLFSDIRPVTRETITIEVIGPGKQEFRSIISSDLEGCFSIDVVRDTTVRLNGELALYEGKFSDCRDAELRLIKRPQPHLVLTDPLTLRATHDIKGVQLVFPFASCKK